MASNHPAIVFPAENEVAFRTLSSAIHLLGVSILAYCLARRTETFSLRALTSIPFVRWLVLFIFVDSWLFIFLGGLLISGVGLSLNEQACTTGIFLCIILYAISKLLIYIFLVERVHVVHPHPSHTRLKSPAYLICAVFVVGYLVIIILAIVGRISYIRPDTDHACIIGLGRVASTSLLVYDLLLNVFFTCMFLYPVYRSSTISPKLRSTAKRNLIAASVALITSAINICVLTILHGQELGWICLASCGADVTVNALAIYSVTVKTSDSDSDPASSYKKGGVESGSRASRTKRIISNIGVGLKRILPSIGSSSSGPHLPIARDGVGVTTSTRGILETGSRMGSPPLDSKMSTRSVHFSPEVTQDKGFVITTQLGSVQEHVRGQSDLEKDSVRWISEPRENPQLPLGSVGQVTISKLSHRESLSSVQSHGRHPRTSQKQKHSHSSSYLPQVDDGEDTSVEVRHEGPAPKKTLSRQISVISSSGSINSRLRSKSVDDAEGLASIDGKPLATSLSSTIAMSDDVWDRGKVMSALTEITGARRKAGVDGGQLEVSVVTQTDRKVEQRRKGSGLVDDYNGRRYEGRSRSYSSSGGL